MMHVRPVSTMSPALRADLKVGTTRRRTWSCVVPTFRSATWF